jgi:hypothetical protein
MSKDSTLMIQGRSQVFDEYPSRNTLMNIRIEGAKYGVSFGSALAMAISYSNNHSLLWAVIHGILSWVYVIYFAIVYA